MALSAAPLKFAVVGLIAPFGGVGALIAGRRYRLTPVLLVALAVGLTVKLDVSFAQHFEAVGQYLPSIGGGAGMTISVALLVAAGADRRQAPRGSANAPRAFGSTGPWS